MCFHSAPSPPVDNSAAIARQREEARQARIVLVALKRYGMMVADNGADWYITGAPNRGWSNDQLHTLGRVTGSSFEVVDTSKLRP